MEGLDSMLWHHGRACETRRRCTSASAGTTGSTRECDLGYRVCRRFLGHLHVGERSTTSPNGACQALAGEVLRWMPLSLSLYDSISRKASSINLADLGKSMRAGGYDNGPTGVLRYERRFPLCGVLITVLLFAVPFCLGVPHNEPQTYH